MDDIEKKAMELAFELHKDQIDDQKKPYFTHLTQVVSILSCVTGDARVLAAGWLHDTLEDTAYTGEQLLIDFGPFIHDLVYEVTQEGTCDSHGYYFPRLKSKEGIMIKFADRLSNLSRMEAWSEDRRAHYLRKSKFWKSE